MEIWKDVVGYEGIYEVSDLGRVRTHKNKTTFTNKHGVRHWKQRILKLRKDQKNGCLSVSLWKNNKGKSFLIHRLVAIAFIPNPNNLYTVNHKDGNRNNNRLDNLEWLSLKDNIIYGFENEQYTKQIKIKVIDISTNKETIFRSLSMANKFFKKNHNYLSSKLKEGKYYNQNYKWEII